MHARPIAVVDEATRAARPVKAGETIIKWMTTTDHKTIGNLYLVTSFAFFLVGGVLALLIRAQLLQPNNDVLSNEQFNQGHCHVVGRLGV